MMELKLSCEAELREIYRRDLAVSFPRAELKPLKEMLAEMRRREYHPWCLFDGREIVGETFVWTHIPGYALLDYLCTGDIFVFHGEPSMGIPAVVPWTGQD